MTNKATIIKVQLPLDMERIRKEGRMYVDHTKTTVMLYDKARKNVRVCKNDRLRKMMLDALDGQGYVKAFVYAEWNNFKQRWDVDFDRGFAPDQDW